MKYYIVTWWDLISWTYKEKSFSVPARPESPDFEKPITPLQQAKAFADKLDKWEHLYGGIAIWVRYPTNNANGTRHTKAGKQKMLKKYYPSKYPVNKLEMGRMKQHLHDTCPF